MVRRPYPGPRVNGVIFASNGFFEAGASSVSLAIFERAFNTAALRARWTIFHSLAARKA